MCWIDREIKIFGSRVDHAEYFSQATQPLHIYLQLLDFDEVQ